MDENYEKLVEIVLEMSSKNPPTKEEAFNLLFKAGIVDENGDLAEPYK